MTGLDANSFTMYLGMCHECFSVKTFHNPSERDLWEKYHPHDEGH